MPIAPENMTKYPGGSIRSPEWRRIRSEIQRRASDRREGSPLYPDCRAPDGAPHPETGGPVVLTVAHLDHDPANNDRANLRLLCQRCHNAHDAPHRRATAARRARAAKAIADLFGKDGE